jgi:protein-L-isoaspartate(D-aspartate) O-methyltransferase
VSEAHKEDIARLVHELWAEGIFDPRVLDAIARTPREIFVPSALRDRAWENTALPIGHGQTISQPFIVAYMTQALEVGDRHKVLEIGTGSGYQAAVLARLCRRVLTIERHRDLLKAAEARFAKLRLHNVTTRFGDGTKGWPEHESFDRIMVTAVATDIPGNLLEHLAEGGVLVAPIGPPRRDQKLVRVRRIKGAFEVEELIGVRFVPLVAGLPRDPATREALSRPKQPS